VSHVDSLGGITVTFDLGGLPARKRFEANSPALRLIGEPAQREVEQRCHEDIESGVEEPLHRDQVSKSWCLEASNPGSQELAEKTGFIVWRFTEEGAIIKRLKEGAPEDHGLCPGDLLLTVNGQNVDGLGQEEIRDIWAKELRTSSHLRLDFEPEASGGSESEDLESEEEEADPQGVPSSFWHAPDIERHTMTIDEQTVEKERLERERQYRISALQFEQQRLQRDSKLKPTPAPQQFVLCREDCMSHEESLPSPPQVQHSLRVSRGTCQSWNSRSLMSTGPRRSKW